MTESWIRRAYCSRNVSNLIFRVGVSRAILFYLRCKEDVAQIRAPERWVDQRRVAINSDPYQSTLLDPPVRPNLLNVCVGVNRVSRWVSIDASLS